MIQPIDGILRTAGQRHSALKQGRNVEIEWKGSEHPARSFREDEDQRESRQHLVEMLPIIEPSDDEEFDDSSGRRRAGEAGDKTEPEGPRRCRHSRAGEGAHHVERTVCEIDQAHDAEDQRQPGSHEKQHDAELKAIEQLLKSKCECH